MTEEALKMIVQKHSKNQMCIGYKKDFYEKLEFFTV